MQTGGHRIGRGLAATITVLAFVAASHAKAPVIVDQRDELRATVIPAKDWCSQVVSVDIRGSRHALEASSEMVQRFIGAIRASVLEDCPSAAIIRLHAFAHGVGMFLAYTSKETGWAIQVFPNLNGALSVLQSGQKGPALSREFAYYETITLFDRARLPGLKIDRPHSNNDADHVTWRLDSVRGATYVLSDGGRSYRSLSTQADAAANVFARQCVNDEAGTIKDPANAVVAADVVTRAFICQHGHASTSTEIIVRRTDNMAAIVVASSEDADAFRTMMGFLTDKRIVY